MDNELRNRIDKNYQHLSNANKLIADTIKSYNNKKFDLKIIELARKSYCSNSAITKFIQSFGYDSYKVFQHDLNNKHSYIAKTIIDSFQIVDSYFQNNKNIIKKLLRDLKQKNRVYFFASGQSKIAAIDFSLKYNKIYKHKCIFESNIIMQETLINTVTKDDCVIFISNSGESRELLKFINNPNLDLSHSYIVTNRINSSIGKKVNTQINLNNLIEPEFSFREYPKESKYSIIYFFDQLFEELISEKIL